MSEALNISQEISKDSLKKSIIKKFKSPHQEDNRHAMGLLAVLPDEMSDISPKYDEVLTVDSFRYLFSFTPEAFPSTMNNNTYGKDTMKAEILELEKKFIRNIRLKNIHERLNTLDILKERVH